MFHRISRHVTTLATIASLNRAGRSVTYRKIEKEAKLPRNVASRYCHELHTEGMVEIEAEYHRPNAVKHRIVITPIGLWFLNVLSSLEEMQSDQKTNS